MGRGGGSRDVVFVGAEASNPGALRVVMGVGECAGEKGGFMGSVAQGSSSLGQLYSATVHNRHPTPLHWALTARLALSSKLPFPPPLR